MGEIEQVMKENTNVFSGIFHVVWGFAYKVADKIARFLDNI